MPDGASAASDPAGRELALLLPDGRSLRAACDIDLARQWVEAIHGPEGWAQLSPAQQRASLTEALTELRRAYAARHAKPHEPPG